jgi:hypothetical protein
MKILFRFVSLFSLLLLPIIYMACSGSEPDPVVEKTEKEKVTEMITASGAAWTTSASSGITVDGVDVTEDLFENFSITFGDGTYTTTGTTPVWQRSDTWSFKDDTAKSIIRGDGKEVTITSVSATQLKLTLTWDQTTYEEGGRKRSIPGVYSFTLNK